VPAFQRHASTTGDPWTGEVVKFGNYIVLLLQLTLASSLSIGLVLGVLILVTGGAEGSISLDIDISASDGVWFLVGTPLVMTLLFLVFSPLSFFVHAAISRLWPGKTGDDTRHN
jgi:hypothetical protein